MTSKAHRVIKNSGLVIYCRITSNPSALSAWRILAKKAHSFLCATGVHDWRYASNYRRRGQVSRARCQYCERRLWEADK